MAIEPAFVVLPRSIRQTCNAAYRKRIVDRERLTWLSALVFELSRRICLPPFGRVLPRGLGHSVRLGGSGASGNPSPDRRGSSRPARWRRWICVRGLCRRRELQLFVGDGPATIVEAPASLVGNIALEGLDARETWPPLLRRGVLMDIDSYAAWERHAIAILTGDAGTPWQALGRIEAATSSLLDWTPGDGRSPLGERVEDAFAAPPRATGSHPDGRFWTVVRGAVPEELERPNLPLEWTRHLAPSLGALEEHASAVCRWLAARLFGAWIAYQGTGLRTILDYLRAALDVLLVEMARGARQAILDRRGVIEAIRRTDRLLIHHARSERLAALLS